MGKLARILVVARHVQLHLGMIDIPALGFGRLERGARLILREQPRRAEKYNGVVHVQPLETGAGLEVLGQDPHGTPLPAVDKRFVLVCLLRAFELGLIFHRVRLYRP